MKRRNCLQLLTAGVAAAFLPRVSDQQKTWVKPINKFRVVTSGTYTIGMHSYGYGEFPTAVYTQQRGTK